MKHSRAMELRHIIQSNSTLALILKVGLLNAVLITLTAAFLTALTHGAGTEDASWARIMQQPPPSQIPDPLEFGKVVLLLCAVLAVPFGGFGLLSGAAQSALMFGLRRWIRWRWFLTGAVAVLFAGLLAVFSVACWFWSSVQAVLVFIVLSAAYPLLGAFVFRKRGTRPLLTD